MRDTGWVDVYDEQGVAVTRVEVKQEGRKLHQRWGPYALVSLHGLARWFERSSHRDHSLLVRDLALLVEAPPERDAVRTPDGFWLGEVRPMKSAKDRTQGIRSVRTFVLEDWREGPR
jgi:hypothetical protein